MKEGKVERGREEPQSAEGDGCSDDRARSGKLDDDNDSSSADEPGGHSYTRSDYLKRDSGEPNENRADDGCEDREQAGDSYTKSD